MGLDIRHQVLRVALSVKVNGKRRRLSLHRARPPRTCVKLSNSMKITVTTSRVGAYPHTQKSGLRRLTGAYPHTKISVAQSYPDPHLFGILRRTTRFSMVSSNQDDSLGIKHLPSAIYALGDDRFFTVKRCAYQ